MTVLRETVSSAIGALRRDWAFRRAIKRLARDPAGCAHPGSPVLADLIYGWGNERFAAVDEYLAACVHHALGASGPTLECGSGLSTLVVGVIAKQRGRRHWALEHSPEWAMRVQRFLKKLALDSAVVLSVKPLKDYGGYVWYDPPLEAMPDAFELVVCDGPPGETRGGRYGLVPTMRERLKPGCVILLDDAHRKQERVAADRWKSELGASLEVFGATRPYIKMTLI